MTPNETNVMCVLVGLFAGIVICAVCAMVAWPDLRVMRFRGRG